MPKKKNTKLDLTGLSPSHTFRSGAGMSGYHVDCSADPYDLRPAADIITGAAHEMLANMPKNQPLVIIMGELHDKPAHGELQHLLAHRLKEDGHDFTVNFELSHDSWAAIARHFMGCSVPESLRHEHLPFDAQGRGSLSSFMGYTNILFAPVSVHNFMGFCYDQAIQTSFNDASITKGKLNLKSLFTSAAAHDYHAHKLQSKNGITLTSPDGMAIRNLVMARRALKHARQTDTRIIIQKTGKGHVFGNVHDGSRYENSLCATYRAAGAAVLPVFPSTLTGNWGLNLIPQSAYQELPNTVVIDDLSEEAFYLRLYAHRRGLYFTEDGEKQFIIDKLHKHSGGELSFYDVKRNSDHYKEMAKKHSDEILQAYEDAQKTQKKPPPPSM